MVPNRIPRKAQVVWWGCKELYVRCPYCNGIHRHPFNGNYEVRHVRPCVCEDEESSRKYSITFPTEGQYEIDRDNALYVRAGADPTEYLARTALNPFKDSRNQCIYTENQPKDSTAITQRQSDGSKDIGQEKGSFSNLHGICLKTGRDGRTVLTMIVHFEVPNEWKTVGILFRGETISDNTFPSVTAMSGWTHSPLDNSNIQIGGKTWTDKVLLICSIIGYTLPEHDRDQGKPGQYYACHAEKQLVAYFLRKHYIFRHELEPKKLDISALMSALSVDETKKQTYEHCLFELFKVRPKGRLKKATILTSTEACEDCTNFVKRVNEVLGVEITLKSTL